MKYYTRENEETTPIGMKIISVICFAVALMLIVSAIILLKFSVITTLVFAVLAIILTIVGIGLWKQKTWAKIILVILTIIIFIDSILGMIGGDLKRNIPIFVVSAIIFGYLMFRKKPTQ